MTVFLVPVGWCAILSALAAGIVFDGLWVLFAPAVGSMPARF